MNRAEKREQAHRAAKDKKQKKILIGIAPLLLLLLAWQGPGMLKAFTGGDKGPVPVVQPEGGAVTTPAPGTDPTAAPAPSTAAPGDAPATAVVTTLPSTDGTAEAGEGQLVAFDRFVGKDPFRQLVEDKEDTGGGGGGGTTPPPGTGFEPNPSAGGNGGGGNGGGGGGNGGGTPATLTSATLKVNGNQEQVSVKGTFPSYDPIFRLKKVTRTGIELVLVTGAFTEGQDAIPVKVGKSVTLVSQPDGQRFVIKLVSVS
jgi:hypothetical protein